MIRTSTLLASEARVLLVRQQSDQGCPQKPPAMALLKVALSLTLLAASAYADVPYVNLTYVPGEGNVSCELLTSC